MAIVVLFENDFSKAFDTHFEVGDEVGIELKEADETRDIADDGGEFPIF